MIHVAPRLSIRLEGCRGLKFSYREGISLPFIFHAAIPMTLNRLMLETVAAHVQNLQQDSY